jgi:hypothetical protein
LAAAVSHIAQVIDASSAADPLTFVLAGPMEVAYQGFLAAQPSKRQYVRCISHSEWNDRHALGHGGHNFDDIIALGCVNAHIRDQNPGLGWARIASVRVVEHIPVNRRHNAKIDLPVLHRMLDAV